ncbi:MAG: sigma-54 dependent transcriptional regulator [Balneolaceae bacterium]
MANRTHTILITDDEKSIRNTLREILEYEGYTVLEAEQGEEALDILAEKQIDLMLLDIKMKGMDGIDVLKNVMDRKLGIPVIMISGHGNIQVAVEATKMGAYDFLEKPPDLNRLLVTLRNALEVRKLSDENRKMRSELHGIKEMIGESHALEEIRTVIKKIAPSKSRVLITGENGTGKELVARWIHAKSDRCDQPFIDVNCAAIPAELLESELFGHEKGAFTGAETSRTGKFEQADGGTLFLDEIGDMSLEAQSKVLRVLQEHELTKVGGSQRIPVDVRILAATNKNLEEEISANNFREDLFHRINVIPIHVPPLRNRSEDIPLLANTFLKQLSNRDIIFSGKSFDEESLAKMQEMPWTGNVRELYNVVERLALLSSGNVIGVKDLDRLVTSKKSREGMVDQLIYKMDTFQEFKEEAERIFLIQKLEKNDWNISRTAEEIQIQRSHIYNKIKKYDIEK